MAVESDVKRMVINIFTKKSDEEILEYLDKALSESKTGKEETDMVKTENVKPYDKRIFRGVKLKDDIMIEKMLGSQPEESDHERIITKNEGGVFDIDNWKRFLTKMNIPFGVRAVPVVDWEANPFDGESCIFCLDIGIITTDLNTYNKTLEYQKVYADNKSTGFISILFNEDGTFRSFVF